MKLFRCISFRAPVFLAGILVLFSARSFDDPWQDLLRSLEQLQTSVDDPGRPITFVDIYSNQERQARAGIALLDEFLRSHPQSEYRFEAAARYLRMHPRFIDRFPEQLIGTSPKDHPRLLDAVPRDDQSRQAWIDRGTEIVNTLLEESGLTLEQRENLEWALFGRDFRVATEDLRRGASPDWNSFVRRFYHHVHTYHALEGQGATILISGVPMPVLGARSQDFLGALYSSNPEIALRQWRDLADSDVKSIAEASSFALLLRQLDAMAKDAPSALSDVRLGMRRHVAQFPDSRALELRIPDYLGRLREKGYLNDSSELNEWRTLARCGGTAVAQSAKMKMGALEFKTGGAPLDLKFTAVDGSAIDTVAMRGNVILLDFWATWCKPCIEIMPQMRGLYAKYKDQGFSIIGVSSENGSLEKFKSYLQEGGYNWPQYFDGKGPAANPINNRFGVKQWPTTMLVGRDGKIIDTNIGFDALERAVKAALETPVQSQ